MDSVIWHITMSLDGFIAGQADAMEWAFQDEPCLGTGDLDVVVTGVDRRRVVGTIIDDPPRRSFVGKSIPPGPMRYEAWRRPAALRRVRA